MRPRAYRASGERLLFTTWRPNHGVTSDGQQLHHFSEVASLPAESLAWLLNTAEHMDCRRVFLVGAKPPERWQELAAPRGWRPDPAGHYMDSDDPAGRWIGPGGRRVEIRRSASWFGEGPHSPEDVRHAWRVLDTVLTTVSKGRAGMMASPAATGQSLWAASLPDDWDAPLTDPETAALIRSTTPQHRMEVLGSCYEGCGAHLPMVGRRRVREIHYLDGRLMYLACTRELPAGPVMQLDKDAMRQHLTDNRYARARVRVRYHVPEGWHGPGLLPERHDDGVHWHAPNLPNYHGETWADALEVVCARSYGWHVAVLEGLVFTGRWSSLDKWTSWVLRARQAIGGDAADPVSRDLALAGVRMLALQTIGAFHSTGRERTIIVASPAEIPSGVTRWETRPDGSCVYRVHRELTGNALAFMRPELSAQVWARARGRVTARMVETERARPGSVLGVWGDALYLDHDPGWIDSGRVGEFRHKGRLGGPVMRPTNLTGLADILGRMAGEL